jgi:hemoglobin
MAMQTETLFQRLGGTQGIAAIVDDIVVAHMENPTIRARFLPILTQPERLSAIKAHTVNFLEMGSGGTAKYEGRSMRDAHKGMNISGEEYMAVLDDIMGVLKKRQIDEQTQKDVLAIAYSLKDDIIRL